MTPFGDTGRRRLVVIGLLAAPLALAGWVGAGIAQGAGVPAPSMEVLPKTDLKYGQTVEIRAHHLPKGSGSVEATICGLQDRAGTTIANQRAADCAGPSAITAFAVEKAWQPNGEFDTKYLLPASTQTFGTNHRSCDHAHRCALVVADATATAPVYRLVTAIFFADQANVSPPAPTTTGVAASGSAQAASAFASGPAAIDDTTTNTTTNTSATTGTATTTTSVRTPGSTTPASARSKPASSSGHKPSRGESTAAAPGGPGSSQNQNGAGSTGGTTSGTVSGSGSGSGQGDVSGSGGGPGPSVGPGGGTSGGGPGPTSPPTTAPPPPVTVPPTLPPTTVPTQPSPSDPVCAGLSDVVQLVGGDPSPLLPGCNLTGTPATPTAPLTGIVGPLLGRH
jgi:hypothetical protein